MHTVIDSLYQPMKIEGKNIDPKYFKLNEDGTYSLTPLMIYSIARDAVDYFKQCIYDLDLNKDYHITYVKQVKDTWSEKMHDEQWKLKYGDKIKEAAIRWQQYKNSHPDEFETRGKRIATGGENENRFLDDYSPDIKLSLTNTIMTYNAAYELLSRFNSPGKNNGTAGPEYETLPFEEPLYSKAQFAHAHKGIRAKISEDVGIPNDKFEVGKVEKVICRIDNKKCEVVGSNDTELKPFIDGLINHITSCTSGEFKNRRNESITPINNEFISNFNNDGVVSDHSSEYIHIYYTESSVPIRIITVQKEDPLDSSYKFYFNIVEGTYKIRFETTILTKADFRKALEMSKNMIVNVDEFNKYMSTIDKTLANL